MNTLIGQKKEQSQRFLDNGQRIPVTLIDVKGNTVIALKTSEIDKYQAAQLGFSMKKKATKAELGHVKGAKLEKAPKFLREVRVSEDDSLEVGSVLNPNEVFEPGDIVDVSGFSKGKGFQGGVKRWGFHGGPKTHGQSDRHRAPGSIGQGTTPGRVYKGKKMAGNMGNENVTVKNLEIIEITDDGVLVVKGLVPGVINGPLMVAKSGQNKNFVPLYKSDEEKEAEEKAKAQESESEEKVEEVTEVKNEKVEEKVESKEEKNDEQDESRDEEKVEKPEETSLDSKDGKEAHPSPKATEGK